MVILDVGLEMPVEPVDARSQQRDLDFRRTGVALGTLVLVMICAFCAMVTGITFSSSKHVSKGGF